MDSRLRGNDGREIATVAFGGDYLILDPGSGAGMTVCGWDNM